MTRMVFGGDRALRRSVARIAEFWTWWTQEGRAAAISVIDGADSGAFVRAIGRRVDAIDRDLSWHLEPGTERAHRLVVSAAGARASHSLVERWRRQAPTSDPMWEYATARSGSRDASGSLRYGGWTIDVAAARFAVRPRGTRIDVDVVHPGFGAAVPERDRGELSILLLDLLIGDVAVERHVARIAGVRGTEGLDARGLAERIRSLETATEWRILHVRRRDGKESILTVAPQLHPLAHLPFDRCTTVRIRLGAGDDAVSTAQDEEQRFTDALGALAVPVATETDLTTRTVRYYSDGADQNAHDLFERTARGRRDVTVEHRYDPDWATVAPLREL